MVSPDSEPRDIFQVNEHAMLQVLKTLVQQKNMWSIVEWTSAFSLYRIIYQEAFPERHHELITCVDTVRSAALQFDNMGWKSCVSISG